MSHTYTLYRARHLATGRVYVGITTMTLKERVRHHRREGPMALQLQREGLDAFEFVALRQIEGEEAAREAEAALIWELGCHEPNGYNRHVRGGKYPGRGGCPGNKNSRRTSVIQLAADGSTVRVWPTVLDAANTLRIARNTIHRAIKRPDYTAGGFKWVRQS